MLVIKPICDKSFQKELCEKCGCEYLGEAFAYSAVNDGELLAIAQFDICGETGIIYGLNQIKGSAEDFEGMFILGRAIMNFLDLSGVEKSEYTPADDYNVRIAKAIGYKQNDGRYTAVLKGMFDGHCSGEKCL